MTDYTKATGSTGTMKIRDTGTVVEFWLIAGSQTYNYNLPWGYTVNGTTDTSNSFRFESGGSWQKLGAWTVSYEQTVTFYLYDTGTSGLGGPTTFSQLIPRSTIPAAPSTPTISSIGSTTATATFTDGSNGGAAIDTRQLSYGKTSSANTTTVASDGSTALSGLTKGTTYYIKARTHNAKGWSAYSGTRSFKTLIEPPAPSTVAISAITQNKVHAKFSGNGDGGSAILEWRVGYGTSSSAPTAYKTGYDIDITGLLPGTKYYFWSQGRNAVGWGSLSASSTATTIAGARVNKTGVWKSAIPYVRVAGIWKVARPWGKSGGVWRESS
jgi:Fibronectin type III domain